MTGVILAAHVALAAITTVKELELSEDEARKLSEASKEVLKHYPMGLSEKTLAWVNLCLVGSTIYGTRMMAWSVRRSTERRPKVAVNPAAPSSPSSAAPPPVNGAPGLDLTPAFMTAPVNDEVP